MELKQELKTYKRHQRKLLKHEGSYVLIFGRKIIGIFKSYDDALEVGYEKFGLQPFFVRQISSTEPVAWFVLTSPICHT